MFLIVIFFDFLSESIDWSQNFYTKNKTQKFCSVRPQMDLFPFFVHFLKILVVLRHCLYCLVLSQLNFSTFAFYKIAKLNARKSVFPVWCNYVKMMSLMTSQLIAYLRLIMFFFQKKKDISKGKEIRQLFKTWTLLSRYYSFERKKFRIY